MTKTTKRWTTLGLGTALLGTGLAACGQAPDTAPPASTEQAASHDGHDVGAAAATDGSDPAPATAFAGMGEGEGEGEGEGGGAGHEIGALPLPDRLAFMSGHVAAGLALYRADEPQMAARHLLHPISETHAAERAGLDALGFEPALFEEVSASLEAGRPAAEVEAELAAAEENLAMVAGKAGGEPTEIIRFLMETLAEEYQVAITDGVVSDPGEYQDAYGFAVVARERARSLAQASPELIEALDALIAMWPEGPVPVDEPTPIGRVLAQASTVAFALPG
ncbi:hypothetical protein [Parvularcula dongshanensis]|uniref:DUF305 domain-containing protein n=1 Tax=Parvularcula dongshanensis TaxID=1173995 RepID=A0A840I5W0_9PROT|nr:hypothetical protein [Parvularcula dongshanensis]MBB4659400.1 hypothetical protein [Parvularcula dongshanensis]